MPPWLATGRSRTSITLPAARLSTAMCPGEVRSCCEFMDTKIVHPSRVGIAAKGAPGRLTTLTVSVAGVLQDCACAGVDASKTAANKASANAGQILVRIGVDLA